MAVDGLRSATIREGGGSSPLLMSNMWKRPKTLRQSPFILGHLREVVNTVRNKQQTARACSFNAIVVRGLYDYQPQGSDELGISEGEMVELSAGPNGGQNYADGWWEGKSSLLLNLPI